MKIATDFFVFGSGFIHHDRVGWRYSAAAAWRSCGRETRAGDRRKYHDLCFARGCCHCGHCPCSVQRRG